MADTVANRDGEDVIHLPFSLNPPNAYSRTYKWLEQQFRELTADAKFLKEVDPADFDEEEFFQNSNTSYRDYRSEAGRKVYVFESQLILDLVDQLLGAVRNIIRGQATLNDYHVVNTHLDVPKSALPMSSKLDDLIMRIGKALTR